jgi:hypothetical protein
MADRCQQMVTVSSNNSLHSAALAARALERFEENDCKKTHCYS